MQKISLMPFLGAIALLMGSCSLLPFNDAEETQGTSEQTPTDSKASPSASKKSQPPSEQPSAQQKPQPPQKVAGLKKSANPDEILQDLEDRGDLSTQEQEDPFSLFSVPPKSKKLAPPPPPSPEPSQKKPTPSPPPSPEPSQKKPASSESPKRSDEGGLPGGDYGPKLTPEPPDPFEPELAKAVEVTGVVEVADVAYAIVKPPNEESSRYVQVGLYLSEQRQVLFKRIERNQDAALTVVLEQEGMEVSKQVGSGLGIAQSESSSTVSIPISLPKSRDLR
ncbi:MAG: hypothetical protein BRC43_05520 [Cyanobacteria bacterium QS_3_48_167]|nr:MAG: hypothetical protein BRC42_02085 [Cyanobacteria bacterium QS_1_48_34]PSO88025.1 MAG: hypothetical protein BRC45_00290 [Cyanobacteria bacterium QS_5_48_63]PSO89003.1 MAG: hypothetical protein BRC43_05520 [Cyanobacteria bacterium QS_3_48_167]